MKQNILSIEQNKPDKLRSVLIDRIATRKFKTKFDGQPAGIKIESINIGLASPIRIRKWAERILPNGKKIGEVLSSKTVNYKTLNPKNMKNNYI